MLKLIILFRSGIADCPHVLVAKAEYFPQVWTLAQLLVPAVQAKGQLGIPGESDRSSHCEA